MPVLIYHSTNGIVFPQIIHEEIIDGSGQHKKLNILQKQKISEKEASLPLTLLAERYPYKGE